jgi:GMP synthase-like glutamine amidotransferase
MSTTKHMQNHTVVIAPPCPTELQAYTNWLKKNLIPFRVLEKDETLKEGEILLLCGGIDYGKNKERDKREITLLHEAYIKHLYIVGICRGLQMVNVSMGGTLSRHIDSNINHMCIAGTKTSSFHSVTLSQSGNAVYETIEVNSRHHQAIDKLAPILGIDAISDDGIIEAASTKTILLVQWHPELDEVFETTCETYVSNWIKKLLPTKNKL